jgi:hypothetical protein
MSHPVVNRLLWSLVTVLVVIGLGRVYDLAVGDGAIPAFTTRELTPLERERLVFQNTTAPLAQSNPARPSAEYWRGLQPTLALLRSVNPSVAEWVMGLYREGRIVFDLSLPVDHPAYQNTLAFQSPVVPYLMLAPGYWQQSDLEKAAILVHEYRHHRQSFPKLLSERMAQVLSLQVLFNPDATLLEEEAYRYQGEFYRALGYKRS